MTVPIAVKNGAERAVQLTCCFFKPFDVAIYIVDEWGFFLKSIPFQIAANDVTNLGAILLCELAAV